MGKEKEEKERRKEEKDLVVTTAGS